MVSCHSTEMLSCCHLQTKFAKVMLSQVSVCPQGGVWQGVFVAGGHAWRGVCVAVDVYGRGGGGGMHGRERAWQGHAWQGACMAGKMATAVGGAHPTEMHSCSLIKSANVGHNDLLHYSCHCWMSTIEPQFVKITFCLMPLYHFPLHYTNNQMRRTAVPPLLQEVTAEIGNTKPCLYFAKNP